MAMKQTTVSKAEVEAFLASFDESDMDTKVNLIQLWGLKLEHAQDFPEEVLDEITLKVTSLLRSPSHLLVISTLSGFLPFFLTRVPSVSPNPHLRLTLDRILSPLIEKLHDSKDKIRGPARECTIILGRKYYESEATAYALTANGPKGKEREGGVVNLWETAMKEILAGRNALGKIEVLRLLVEMRSNPADKLPLKPWISNLVDLLEDSDGSVRDQARETVVALFSPLTTPSAARTELKKLILARNIRKSIADVIITRVLGTSIGQLAPTVDHLKIQVGNSKNMSNESTPAPDDVQIVYIASDRDLEDEIKAMVVHFEGKETEQNWLLRERSLVRIRGMLRGEVFAQYSDSLLSGLRGGIVDGVTKTLLSLRTTVAQQSCALVQELAEYLGASFDIFVEQLLPTLRKMSCLTKKLIAEKSQRAVTAIILHCSTSPRIIVAHIALSVHDKSVQSRQYGLIHLKTFCDCQSIHSITSIKSTPGLIDQISQIIVRGLTDINPQTRESARTSFWSFEKIWPSQGAVILESLDNTAKRQLERSHPHGVVSNESIPDSPSNKPRVTSATSAILAAKRAKAAELNAGRLVDSRKPTAPSDHMFPSSGHPSSDNHGSSRTAPGEAVESSVFEAHQTTEQLSHSASVQMAPIRHRQLPESPVPRDGGIKSTVVNSESKLPGLTIPLSRIPPPSLETGQLLYKEADFPTSETSANLRNSAQLGISVYKPSQSSQILSYRHSPQTPQELPVNSTSFETSPTRQSLLVSHAKPGFDFVDLSVFEGLAIDSVDEAKKCQVEQSLSAAQQLLDFDDDAAGLVALPSPMTPIRPTSILDTYLVVSSLLTPPAGRTAGVKFKWEDSPKTLTPKLLNRLKSRGYERSWWMERQVLLDQATPLKDESSQVNLIQSDVETLAAGRPTLRNLQKLSLFSAANPISLPDLNPDGKEDLGTMQMWKNGGLFDRIFTGLMMFFEPDKPIRLLEQGLVVLWELIQNQWVLCENREDTLLDGLFRLRACNNPIILESTNSLVSLLTEICDPPFMMSVLHAALDRFLVSRVTDVSKSEDIPAKSTNNEDAQVLLGDTARASAYNFGLNAMGMCVLHLPREAVEVEGKRLESQIMSALQLSSSQSVLARQAAYRVILAIQCILGDDVRTLALFPSLDAGQRSFSTYLMQQNGIIGNPCSGWTDSDDDRRKAVLTELIGGLAKEFNFQ